MRKLIAVNTTLPAPPEFGMHCTLPRGLYACCRLPVTCDPPVALILDHHGTSASRPPALAAHAPCRRFQVAVREAQCALGQRGRAHSRKGCI